MKKWFNWGIRKHTRKIDRSKDHVMLLLYDLMVNRIEDKDYAAMKTIEELADIYVKNGYKELRGYMFNYFVSRIQLEDNSVEPTELNLQDLSI